MLLSVFNFVTNYNDKLYVKDDSNFNFKNLFTKKIS